MIFLLCRNHHHAATWREQQEMPRHKYYHNVVVCATDDPSTFVRLLGRKYFPQDKLLKIDDEWPQGKYAGEVIRALRSIGANLDA